MTFTPEDYRMAQLASRQIIIIVIIVPQTVRQISLRHHSIDAKLKNADWNQPTGKKE